MRRVSTEDFIRIVQERMAKGQSYEVASSNLMTEDEKQRSRLELTEADLHGTRAAPEFNDDGELIGGDMNHTMLEFVETKARDSELYDNIGWTAPPSDPADLVTAADARGRLYAAMRECLSQQDIAILLAAEVDGLPYRRIAREFSMSKSAVARHVAQSKARLKASLTSRK